MMMKTSITYGIAILLFVIMGVFFYQSLGPTTAPATTTENFGVALWGTWGLTIVIVGFIIFAGGAGILVLLGGGWRWE